MSIFVRYIRRVICLPFVACALILACGTASAATFGTVVPVRGQLSDIAFDAKRRLIYGANFSANRIEVLSVDTQALRAPIVVPPQPSSVAVSPDGRYLVVGHYSDPPPLMEGNAITIVNLETYQKQTLTLGSVPALAVAFGNSSKALVITGDGVKLLDPASATITPLSLTNFDSTPLPVPWATFPPQIIRASAGVSGDGNVIYALVDGPPQSNIVRYQVDTGTVVLTGTTSSPQLGPRIVSVDQTGSSFMAGWVLFANTSSGLVNMAEFPYAPGVLNQGGHAFDAQRGRLYAQVTPGTIQTPSLGGPVNAPLLQVVDSDNLNVREILQLQENLGGKSILIEGNMFAVSDSGLTILPVGSLDQGMPQQAHRIATLQEDIFVQASGCDQQSLTQFLDVVDSGGGAIDFSIALNSKGVKLSASSGTTPARIQIWIDPVAFQGSKGTTVVPLQLSSIQGVNLPRTVRLLVNTRDPDQQGEVHNNPGKIVDILADPVRNRFFAIRQDANQVLVMDGVTRNQIAVLRTGNTPVQMAVSGNKLLVTNDHSQLVNVFDLTTLTPLSPVILPSGYYARSIAVANSQILATTRSAAGPPPILSINLVSGTAIPAYTGIFQNVIDSGSALTASPSGQTIFLNMPDGTVALYDDSIYSHAFVVSRKDISGLAGGYAALSDNLFVSGGHLFNAALVPSGQIDLLGGVSSGVALMNGRGIVTSFNAPARNGTIQKVSDATSGVVVPMRMPESPATVQALTSTPYGQTGQTILPFTRTLAVLADGQNIVQLSTSGFSVIPATYDAPRQVPVINGVTNAADLTTSMAGGGLISIWGNGLTAGIASAGSLPLPRTLGGVCVYLNSVSLPLLFVSSNQINAQLPFNVQPGANLLISSANGLSAPYIVPAQSLAPAIFRTPSGGPMIIRTVDGKFITDSTPIHLNEVLIIYLTGMGGVSSTPNDGDASPSTPLATTNVNPVITIGGSPIFTLWSGLAPGLVGVYQVNAQVPFHKIPTGSNIPFTITQGGVSTTVKLTVSN